MWVSIAVVLVAWWAWSAFNSREPAQTQQPLRNTGSTFNDLDDAYSPSPLPAYSPVPLPSFSPVPLPSFSPLPAVPYSPPVGYYENPAPGDDGTTDCPPGGGPVYVGSNDPNGFDGDGDGWGCE
jgi:hypothetical protein